MDMTEGVLLTIAIQFRHCLVNITLVYNVCESITSKRSRPFWPHIVDDVVNHSLKSLWHLELIFPDHTLLKPGGKAMVLRINPLLKE